MITSVYIGITAYVFTMILTDPDMIFGWYGKLLDKLPSWIAKPLGKCEYCLAGQMALWYYIYLHYADYNAVNHIFYISISIFVVEVINNLIIYFKK